MESNKQQLIECELITGEKKIIPANELVFRPAVYAVIYNAPKLLLVNTKSTGKWFFPGGAIEKGEKAEESLRREVQEETGIQLMDTSFFLFKESFFYYEPHNTGYHCFNLFFLATSQDEGSPVHKNQDATDEADGYEWVDINTLKPSDMQSFAAEVLEKFRSSLVEKNK